MRTALGLIAVLAFVGAANANLLTNGDLEYQETLPYGSIFAWGPNGSWAPHSAHTPSGGGYDAALGANFAYYSAQGAETVGQVLTDTFVQGATYDFGIWATGGGSGFGDVVLQIGYDLGGEFQLLATETITTTSAWAAYDGVSYTTGATGDELGMPIWVRLGDGVEGAPGDSDIWFDNLTLTPEPASIFGLALGLLALRRR